MHEHIEQGRAGLDTDGTADVRTLLDRAGDPAAIAAKAGAPPPDSRRWDAWAPWLIIFGPIASGPGWIAGVDLPDMEPARQADRHRRAARRLGGSFFGLVAAMGGRRLTLPLALAILLAVAGLAAHVLLPIHLMRTRRQQQFTFTRSAR